MMVAVSQRRSEGRYVGVDLPDWAARLASEFTYSREDSDAVESGDLRPLQAVIRALRDVELPSEPLAVPGQPFDAHLLAISPMYKRSRALFNELGGRFRAQLMSKHRALTSDSLLEDEIQYSPIEREFAWMLEETARLDYFGPSTLKYLKETTIGVYHEQNHRILFSLLPGAPAGGPELTRYLNFVEAVAITLDHAQSNEIGRPAARVFNAVGVLSNNGTDILREHSFTCGEYRTYLSAYCYATYLNLQLFRPREILDRVPEALSVELDLSAELLQLAVLTAIRNVDVGFVRVTNPGWQQRHGLAAARKLRKDQALVIGDDVGHPGMQFELSARIVEHFGL